jgi:hypothetical protein
MVWVLFVDVLAANDVGAFGAVYAFAVALSALVADAVSALSLIQY